MIAITAKRINPSNRVIVATPAIKNDNRINLLFLLVRKYNAPILRKRYIGSVIPNVAFCIICGSNAIKDVENIENFQSNNSPLQALLCTKAGATYVSPFVGRLDDVGAVGMDLIKQIRTIFDNYDYSTEILVASVRNPIHV